MGPTPGFRGNRADTTADTRRWLVMLVVLAGSLAVYGVERWMRTTDGPIVGYAHVADGDTLTISGTRIRLVDIDAPELAQNCTGADGRDWPCGRQASDRLHAVVQGRELTCLSRSRDQYDRALAVCTLPDKTDINAWMVRQGWAVTYDRGQTYGAEQNEARSAKRGMWAGTFTPPREWRRQHPRNDHSD